MMFPNEPPAHLKYLSLPYPQQKLCAQQMAGIIAIPVNPRFVSQDLE